MAGYDQIQNVVALVACVLGVSVVVLRRRRRGAAKPEQTTAGHPLRVVVRQVALVLGILLALLYIVVIVVAVTNGSGMSVGTAAFIGAILLVGYAVGMALFALMVYVLRSIMR